jgi:pyroglutamyl-peptidase
MRILLTAFEPFDGTGLNSSFEGCRAFLSSCGEGARARITFLVLPVEYGADTDTVEQALAEGAYGLLLHTGQASGAAAVRVERRAVNSRYAAAPSTAPGTTSPRSRDRAPIDPDGPETLEATVPVYRMASAVAAAGIPSMVTEDAGVYLCNHVLYHSLLREQRCPTGARVGFLHVPCLPEQAKPGEAFLAAEEIGRAVGAALEAALA